MPPIAWAATLSATIADDAILDRKIINRGSTGGDVDLADLFEDAFPI